MARWSSFFLISATILILTVVGLSSTVQGSGDHHLGWIPTTTTTRSSICNKGSIAECMAEDGEEFEMDTEINRRILATSKIHQLWCASEEQCPLLQAWRFLL
ncbi:PROTEIN RALF-LIKE 33 [Salix koriyanagi]|uniref:PROTEIN RALF-LIKE 33 n=1 Tax=Salix koriyanagi TaxID=2511006 RepID=A0A9Q0SN16_9ROSI|nr:PROTEIN RALF-LIKE 33 [Salix koriyanagi]